MTLVDSPDIWTKVTDSATVVLAAASFIGWLSLRFSQKSYEADERRKSKATAIKQNEKFLKFILRHTEIADTLQKDQIQNMEALDPVLPYKPHPKLLDASMDLMNKLESWALYVETGLADEALVFKTSGIAFCEQVATVSAIIRMSRTIGPNEWKAAFQLRDNWSSPHVQKRLRA